MTKLKTAVLLLFTVTAMLYSGGQQDSDGNNIYEYDMEDFSGIVGSSSFDIEVKQSDKFSVKIIADRSYEDKLIVDKRGGDLHLGLKPFSSFNLKSPRAIITMPVLESVELSGASSLLAAGFDSNRDFNCELSGASSLTIDIICEDSTFELSGASDVTGVIETDHLDIELYGSSDMELYGTGEALTAELQGASSGDLINFLIEAADIELNGSSSLHINLDGNLNIDASGASNLYYTGNIIMGDIDLSGASSVKEE